MKKLTIILDAAHGVNVPGKQSPNGTHKEYLWSRNTVAKLKLLLEYNGYTVFESCPMDKEIGLTNRVKATNSFAGDNKFFISLHNNAAGDGTKWMNARGVEIFTTKGQTTSDKYAEVMMKQLMEDFPELSYRKDTTDGDLDKEENFTVLMCKCPAVLVEWLFQDNIHDYELLQDDEINYKFCHSLLKAINTINDSL